MSTAESDSKFLTDVMTHINKRWGTSVRIDSQRDPRWRVTRFLISCNRCMEELTIWREFDDDALDRAADGPLWVANSMSVTRDTKCNCERKPPRYEVVICAKRKVYDIKIKWLFSDGANQAGEAAPKLSGSIYKSACDALAFYDERESTEADIVSAVDPLDRVVDGVTVRQCLEHLEKHKSTVGVERVFGTLSIPQRAAVRTEWSRQLREKVRAGEEEDRERETRLCGWDPFGGEE